MRRLKATAAAALALASPSARAVLWTVDGSAQVRAEWIDNLALVSTGAVSSTRITWLADFTTARQTETASTQLNAGVSLRAANAVEARNQAGHLTLSRSISSPTDTWNTALQLLRDSTIDDRRTASDVALGDSNRTSRQLTASWQHSFDPRWSSQLQASVTSTGYSGGAGSASNSYRDRSLTAGLNLRWNELLTLGASITHSNYVPQVESATSSATDSFKLTATRELTERSSATFAVGSYRTRSQSLAVSSACPLQRVFCDSGLVVPVRVFTPRSSSATGAQYDIGYDWAISEVGSLHLSTSRQISPSGAGVVRSDNHSAGLSRTFSPTLRGAATLSQSQTAQPGTLDGVQPRLRSLEMSLTWNLSERWTMTTAAVVKRYEEPRMRVNAGSTAISITLQYQPPKIFATR